MRKKLTRRDLHPPGIRNGFTLLEVMVALVVMSIVLVSIYKMQSQTLTMTTAARFFTYAPQLAQKKLTELETTALDDFASDSGDFGEEFPGYRWQASIEEVSVEALGETAADLKKIDIMVSFDDNKQTYRLRTYRFARE
ncbi:MAG: prepilin-type N-terminal cleavage/methylation domain-containing protein [Desulfobacterales bacterium]|nr:MAG: prepilin-type N-terminal cleavage/methylation domain-containing protein [Desulfobacterales bacterium]